MEDIEDRLRVTCPDSIESPVARGAVLAGILGLLWVAGSSMDAVPPLQYGIRYNEYSKYVETDRVYHPGRYFLGPWNSFMLFPSDVQTIEFTNEVMLQSLGQRFPPLHTRTKEGLALHMKASVQYRLNPNHVGQLYKEFSHDYESFFVSQMRNTLIRVAADYEAPDFWNKRLEIGQIMQRSLSDTLKRTYADCWGFQLMNMELPVDYDTAIVATQVVNQGIDTNEFDQKAKQIRAETQVIEAEFAKKVKIIKAHGLANKTLTIKVAKANTKSNSVNAETDIMTQVKARLSLDPKALVDYQEYSTVATLTNASMYFGFEDAAGLIMQPMVPPVPRSLAADAAPDMSADSAGRRRLFDEL